MIKTFAADLTSVSPGAAVKLSFTTEGARELSLIDQSGVEIPITGTVTDGSAIVTPARTSFYVLRATGDGGKDSAFVQVAVSEGLKQVFLIAVPTEVASGETVELVWSALGGANVSLKDTSGATLSTAESGTQSATPEKTTTWTLRADGSSGVLSATARVTVRPVIKEFSASPPAARQGEKITLSWRTAGADGVVVSEATFGPLVSTATDVATGTHQFTVPTDFDGPSDGGTLADGGVAVARPVPDNFPLRFTLTATANSPMQVVSATLESVVRDGPVINTFEVPDAVTEGKPFTLKWSVSGFRTQLLLDGVPVYGTVPPASASGSLVLPGLAAETVITLVAYDYLGLKVSQSRLVKVVKAPKVVTFTLPATVATAGSATSASWTTTDATLLVLRIKDGPAVLTVSTPSQITTGTGTVHPTSGTTFVLEAYNAAGDVHSLEQTVAVTTPATASASPNPTSPNTVVQLSWDVAGLNPTEVLGIPSEVVQVIAASTAFVDLENVPGATRLFFADRSEGTAAFTVPSGYRFPFISSQLSTFTAGVNGFLALAATTGSTLINNVDLKGTTGLPTVPLIAPFWDNLDLGTNGGVYWLLEGTTFPRRLIVQWNKLNVGSDPASVLTFQVQLYETGELRFLYQTLTDTAGTFAQGQAATVGIWAPGTFAGQHSFNTPTLAQGQELAWFGQGAATGTASLKVGSAGVTPGFFYKTAAGGYGRVDIPIRVFGLNSVKVNEAMPTPEATIPQGQYVELYNPQLVPLDLSGLELVANVTPLPGYLLPAGTVIAPRGLLLLGQSVDLLQNGEAPVTVAYGTDVTLTAATDGVRLQIPAGPADGGTGFEISRLAWTTSTAAESVQAEIALGTLSCTRTQKYGTTVMQTGTPGARNESCFEYTLENIPVSYLDISTTGTVLTGPGDEVMGTLDLSAAPFPHFKVPTSAIKASSNGFLLFDSTSTATASFNRTAPSTSTTSAKGSAAIFWDDLNSTAMAGSSIYSQRIAAGADPANPGAHWIIQWHHYTQDLSTTDDDLNFQAKLFDTGVIEYHYGQMVNGSGNTTTYASGSSATVWMEQKTGAAALPISVNLGTIEPNTAYRFTPKP